MLFYFNVINLNLKKHVIMKVHKLKTWSKYYQLILCGIKDWELRKNDRDFKVGDLLILEEYLPEFKSYTGNSLKKKIEHIFQENEFGLKKGYCILGLKDIKIYRNTEK